MTERSEIGPSSMRKAFFRILEQCAVSVGPREGILGGVTMTNITLRLKLFPLFVLSAELVQLVLRDEPFLFLSNLFVCY